MEHDHVITTLPPRPQRLALKHTTLQTLCLASVLLLPSMALAGPWTKGPGEAYVKFSQLYFGSNTYVDAQGNRVEGADYVATTSSLYAEVGVLEGLHLQTFVPYIFSRNYFEQQEASYANVGFGDTLFAVQWTPVKTKIPWALKLETKIPMYDLGAVEGPQAIQFPALGDGQVDATLWGGVGASLYPLPIYGLIELGYRHRTALYLGEDNGRRYKNTAALNGQVGAMFLEDRVIVAANVNGAFALGEDEVTQSFLTVGPSVAVYVWKKFALEATVSPMVYSKNNSPGTTYSLGISYQPSPPEDP